MNFDRTGWLGRYLAYRNAHPFGNTLPSAGVRVLEDTGMHHELDEAVYYFLQPTGLFYGFPVGLPFPEPQYPDGAAHAASDRVHLIFLESLFACMVADRHFLLEGLTDEPEHFTPAVRLAAGYFAPDTSAGERTRWWSRRPGGGGSPEQRLERALRGRIGMGGELFRLPGHYYNSFLFLDLYYCMLWQRRMLMDPDSGADILHELATQQAAQRELLIRLMIAAAAVSGEVVRAEQRLVEWFIRSSGLPSHMMAELREALRAGRAATPPDIPEMPWLVRRFMLEAVLMTMLVDRVLSPSEDVFLREVVESLQLWKEELEQSKIALEVFILHQEDRLRIFQDRPALLNASDNVREQAAVVIRKNLSRIVQEIRETQELYNLLMKSTHMPLSAEEKLKVRAQLLDILKTIPALAIFALPGGGLILPVLIRLLPFNLLPSSFEQER